MIIIWFWTIRRKSDDIWLSDEIRCSSDLLSYDNHMIQASDLNQMRLIIIWYYLILVRCVWYLSLNKVFNQMFHLIPSDNTSDYQIKYQMKIRWNIWLSDASDLYQMISYDSQSHLINIRWYHMIVSRIWLISDIIIW